LEGKLSVIVLVDGIFVVTTASDCCGNVGVGSNMGVVVFKVLFSFLLSKIGIRWRWYDSLLFLLKDSGVLNILTGGVSLVNIDGVSGCFLFLYNLCSVTSSDGCDKVGTKDVGVVV
jgi:hypothetical protein